MKKNVVIAVLCAVAVSLTGVIIGISSANKEKNRRIDDMFTGAYNMLITEARNGNISNDLQSPNRYDIETAKYTYLINKLFLSTSYSDNEALFTIVALLDDSVGSHRFYPEFSFADMPQETYEMLFDLSLHFDDEKLAQKALDAFKAELGENRQG